MGAAMHYLLFNESHDLGLTGQFCLLAGGAAYFQKTFVFTTIVGVHFATECFDRIWSANLLREDVELIRRWCRINPAPYRGWKYRNYGTHPLAA